MVFKSVQEFCEICKSPLSFAGRFAEGRVKSVTLDQAHDESELPAIANARDLNNLKIIYLI